MASVSPKRRKCSRLSGGDPDYHTMEVTFATVHGVASMSKTDKLDIAESRLRSKAMDCISRLPSDMGLGMAGELTTASATRMIDRAVELDAGGSTANRIFCDLGSGIGRPSFVAALSGYFNATLGVEMISSAVKSANNLAKSLGIDRDTRFLVGDLSAALPRELYPVTHFYSFSKGMPPSVLKPLAASLNKHKQWRVLATTTSPATWKGYGLRFISSPGHVPGYMVGSHSNHAVHFMLSERCTVTQPEGGATITSAGSPGTVESAGGSSETSSKAKTTAESGGKASLRPRAGRKRGYDVT